MKYFKLIDNEVYPGGEIIYYELDKENNCFRAIFEDSNKLLTTNFINNDFLPGIWFVDNAFNDIFEEITENEFNNKWKMALKPFLEKWNEIKKIYNIGKDIKVKINNRYPQGIIFDINEMFYGIADYEECKMKYGIEKIYPKYECDMQIIGYDEDNMWIKLKTN